MLITEHRLKGPWLGEGVDDVCCEDISWWLLHRSTICRRGMQKGGLEGLLLAQERRSFPDTFGKGVCCSEGKQTLMFQFEFREEGFFAVAFKPPTLRICFEFWGMFILF